MNNTAFYAILSVFIVSLTSLTGLVMISASKTFITKLVNYLISFAAGALLGDVFIHLLPDLVKKGQFSFVISLFILATILLFFILERLLHWYHHHLLPEDSLDQVIQPLALINLFGSSLHNITDGLVIGAAYLLDFHLGIITTVAVIFHEIPREIGDFAVFIYGGFTKTRALFYNFLSGLIALFGVLLALYIGKSQQLVYVLAALAIGSFIYIAMSDLIPETHKEKEKFWAHLVTFASGIGIMFLLLLLD